MKTTAFKNTDIGPIPEDWEVKTIEDFYEVGSSKRVFQSQWRTSGIPFYRARDIVGFHNGEKAVGGLYIDESLYKAYKRSYGVPAPGDLLVTAVGTLGKVFRVVDEAPFYFKDGNIIWFRANGQYDSCLLEQLFESGWLDSQIYDTAGGSTVGTYTITNAKKTLIPLPPLSEQRRIAAALSDADELVASLDKLIEKKKRVKEGAMQRLLSGETRLPGFTGKWVEKKLGECGTLVRDSINPQDHLDESFDEYSMPSYDEGKEPRSVMGAMLFSNKTPIQGEVVLFNKLNVRKQRIWYVKNAPRNAICSSEFLPICSKTIDLEFLSYLLATEKVTSMFVDRSSGTSNSQKRITPRDFELFEVVIPATLTEQRAIAAVLSDMDAEIAALSRERAEAARIKQGMMQELLTGKTRLKGE